MWIIFSNEIVDRLVRMETLMGKVADAVAPMSDQLDKAKKEILDKIDKGSQLDPDDTKALDSLKAKVQEIDDIVPDVTPTPTPEPNPAPPTPPETPPTTAGPPPEVPPAG
jgi:hypothetical protein